MKKTYFTDDRIYFTRRNYLTLVKWVCIVLFVLGIAASSFLIWRQGVTYMSLITSFLLITFNFIVCNYAMRNTRSVSLKGDVLILSAFGNKNIVTPIGSIRTVRSRALAGAYLTRIRYKLDGFDQSFFFISRNVETRSPEDCLRDAIVDKEKKKKEANHKPGPVLTQSA